MKRHLIWIVVLAAALAAVLFYFWWPQRKVEALYGGSAGLTTASDPDEVEAFRIGPQFEWDKRPEEQAVLAGPISVPRDVAKRISGALRSPGSYIWDAAKACEPNPGVRLSFRRGTDRIDLLLCFECNILLAYRNGEEVGGEDFDPIRQNLVRAVKAVFPDDEVITTLAERE